MRDTGVVPQLIFFRTACRLFVMSQRRAGVRVQAGHLSQQDGGMHGQYRRAGDAGKENLFAMLRQRMPSLLFLSRSRSGGAGGENEGAEEMKLGVQLRQMLGL